MILAGDVGGTKVHLALFDFTDGNLKHTRDKQFPAKEYSGLEEIVKEFVLTDKVTSACFRRAGPGAGWAAAADQPAVDAGQPRVGARS